VPSKAKWIASRSARSKAETFGTDSGGNRGSGESLDLREKKMKRGRSRGMTILPLGFGRMHRSCCTLEQG
jgi:hypothetical protein